MLVRRWTTWQIGNGKKVLIEEDIWVVKNDDYGSSEGLIILLHAYVIFSLHDAISHNRNGMGRKRWKIEDVLTLERPQVEE